ncbi:MAG: LamG-like jellyroll fold domain-containing protein [Kiritimatiellia bacterium]
MKTFTSGGQPVIQVLAALLVVFPLRAEMLLHYPLDEAPVISSTNQPVDRTGKTLVAGVNGTLESVPGAIGGAINFDHPDAVGWIWLARKKDDVISRINHASKTTGWSGSYWVKGGAQASANLYTMEGEGEFRWVTTATNVLSLVFNDVSERITSLKPFDDVWNHIAWTVDLTRTTSNIHVYYNGAWQGAYDADLTKAGGIEYVDPDDERLFFGGRSNGGNAFDGALDDIAFWDQVLTKEEISRVHARGAASYAGP